jgi:26S proteasome regulatory subunit N8
VAVGTLSTRITSQLQSLQGLHLRLRDIGQYLQKVIDGDLPVNHAILGNLQDVFNLLPNLSTPKPSAGGAQSVAAADNSELTRAMSVKTNDQLMAIYLSSLIRAITAFHDLIENKIQNRQQAEEKENGGKKDEEKDGEKKEGEAEKEGEKKANGVNGATKEGEKGKENEKGGKKKS